MTFAKSVERRVHQRSRVSVPGRLMLANRRECSCTVIDVSPGGMAIETRESGAVGEPVVLYLERAGRLQGDIVRLFAGGFAIRLTGNSRAADTLVQRFATA